MTVSRKKAVSVGVREVSLEKKVRVRLQFGDGVGVGEGME